MLNVQRTDVAVIVCLATAPALDAFISVPEAYGCRVAPDELWLLAPPGRAGEVEGAAAAYCARAEPGAIVLDQSDGWSTFTLRGDEATVVFAQLSAIPLPTSSPAFVQGAVAGGPAKVFVLGGAIHVLVPSTLRHHLAGRLRDVCGSRATFLSGEVAFLADRAAVAPAERASAAATR